MNTKGNVTETVPILFMLFGVAVAAIFVSLLLSVINADFQADTSLPVEARTIMGRAATEYPQVADFFFVLLFTCIPLISAVFAYFNNIHPVFFWLSLPVVIIVVFWGASLSELYTDIAEDTELTTYAQGMPMTYFIMSNFGMYSMYVFVCIAAGTFFKLRGGQRDLYGGFQ